MVNGEVNFEWQKLTELIHISKEMQHANIHEAYIAHLRTFYQPFKNESYAWLPGKISVNFPPVQKEINNWPVTAGHWQKTKQMVHCFIIAMVYEIIMLTYEVSAYTLFCYLLSCEVHKQ